MIEWFGIRVRKYIEQAAKDFSCNVKVFNSKSKMFIADQNLEQVLKKKLKLF